jgi:hypothetical protein
MGGHLGHRLDDLPRLGDQPIVEPPDIDDRDPWLGTGKPAPRYVGEPFRLGRRGRIRLMVGEVIAQQSLRSSRTLPQTLFRSCCDRRSTCCGWDWTRTDSLLEWSIWPRRAALRVRVARQLGVAPDADLAALYEELLALGSEDASHPSESEVVVPMIFGFGGRELRLFSTITTFGTPMDITLDEGRDRVVLPGGRGERRLLHEPRRCRSSRHVATVPVARRPEGTRNQPRPSYFAA